MTLPQIKFREDHTPYGNLVYEPANQQAFEVVEFLQWNDALIPEYRFDKLWDWLTGLGHDVVVVSGEELKSPPHYQSTIS